MNKLVSSIKKSEKSAKTTTTNGMKARVSSKDYVLDLFYAIGASRGKDILPTFFKAYNEDKELALRVVMWSRDIRGGSGERQLYLDIISGLEKIGEIESAKILLNKVPELGRFKDLLLPLENTELKHHAFSILASALEQKNGLAAKWTPRQGKLANELRKFLNKTFDLNYSPKEYRQKLVELSKTVEQDVSAGNWHKVVYSHVPSKAMNKLNRAFKKHDEDRFDEYKSNLVKGTEKVNVGTLYPYDVLNNRYNDEVLAEQQWLALPNYIGEQKILPMVDVSGSMEASIAKGISAMDVAVSLGLYIATKSSGPLKNTLLSFTNKPQLIVLPEKDSLHNKINLIERHCGYSTNINQAYEELLSFANKNQVPQDDMPDFILMLSDMQFDSSSIEGKSVSALKMIKQKYKQYNYEMPKLVFWNLNSHSNVPAKSDSENVALVSGFSPSIVKSVLAATNFNPRDVMLDTIMVERYDL